MNPAGYLLVSLRMLLEIDAQRPVMHDSNLLKKLSNTPADVFK